MRESDSGEKHSNSAEVGNALTPGFTSRRLAAINKKLALKRANLGAMAKSGLESEVAVSRHFPAEKSDFLLGLEGALLAQGFSSEIWQRAINWRQRNNANFGLIIEKQNGVLRPIPNEAIAERCAESASLAGAVDILDNSTSDILVWAVQEMDNDYRRELDKLQAETPVEENLRNYKRYLKVMQAGAGKVVNADREKVKNPVSHMVGGLNAARKILTGLLKVLDGVCALDPNLGFKVQTDREQKENLVKLVDGAQLLVLSMADSSNRVSGTLEEELKKLGSGDGSFDAEKFWISKQGAKLFLEVRPEVLNSVEDYMAYGEPDEALTGCPLLSARSPEGRSIMLEFFKFYSDLYKQYCIPNWGNYRKES